RNRKVTGNDLKRFVGCKSLKSLQVSGDQLTEEGLSSLQQFPDLQTLEICAPAIDDALSRMKNFSDIPVLNVVFDHSDQRVPHQGYRTIAKNQHVRVISLREDASGSPNNDEILAFAS